MYFPNLLQLHPHLHRTLPKPSRGPSSERLTLFLDKIQSKRNSPPLSTIESPLTSLTASSAEGQILLTEALAAAAVAGEVEKERVKVWRVGEVERRSGISKEQ